MEAALGKRSRSTASVKISFIDEGMEHVTGPHYDALVITAEINDFDVNRILVISENSTYIVFLDALLVLWKEEKDLKKVGFLLIRLDERIPP